MAVRANAQNHLRLSWRERGVALGDAASPRKGFGTRIIETSIPHVLGGTSKLFFGKNGVTCDITFPLPEREDPSGEEIYEKSDMKKPLDGLKILIVEDEFLASLEISAMIEALGGAVVGPTGRLDEADGFRWPCRQCGDSLRNGQQVRQRAKTTRKLSGTAAVHSLGICLARFPS